MFNHLFRINHHPLLLKLLVLLLLFQPFPPNPPLLLLPQSFPNCCCPPNCCPPNCCPQTPPILTNYMPIKSLPAALD